MLEVKTVRQRAAYFRSRFRVTEEVLMFDHALLTAIIGGWAFVWAMPNGRIQASPGFALYLAIMPQWLWAALFAVVFLIGLSGLGQDERWVRRSTQCLSFTHGMIASIAFLSSWATTATMTYAIISASAAGLVWMRRKQP